MGRCMPVVVDSLVLTMALVLAVGTAMGFSISVQLHLQQIGIAALKQHPPKKFYALSTRIFFCLLSLALLCGAAYLDRRGTAIPLRYFTISCCVIALVVAYFAYRYVWKHRMFS